MKGQEFYLWYSKLELMLKIGEQKIAGRDKVDASLVPEKYRIVSIGRPDRETSGD